MRETLYKLAAWTSALLLAISGCGSGKGNGELGSVADFKQEAESPADSSFLSPELHQLLAEALEKELQRFELRSSSSAPLHESSRVTDLRLSETVSGQLDFAWSIKLAGDYDANGIVNASDLVPLGQHFGLHTYDIAHPYGQLIDGDANGEIGLSDIVPIAQNFQARCDGFELQGSNTPNAAGGWHTIAALGSTAVSIDPLTARRSFTFAADAGGFEFFQVLPWAETPVGERDYGLVSNVVFNFEGLSGPSSWYCPGASESHTNSSPAVGPAELALLWQTPSPQYSGDRLTAPVICDDGTMYCVESTNRIRSFNPDGTENWTFDPNLPFSGYTVDPAGLMISSDGRMFLISHDSATGGLIVLSPAGVELSRHWFDTYVSLPVETQSGQMFAATRYGLVGLDSQGNENLRVDLGGNESTPEQPLKAGDGSLYVWGNGFAGAQKGTDGLVKLNADLEIMWQIAFNDRIRSLPTLLPNGDVCIALHSAIVTLDMQGAERWRRSMVTTRHTYARRQDGSVVCAVYNDDLVPHRYALVCLGSDGLPLWSYSEDSASDRLHSPVTDSEGKTYFASDSGSVICLDESGAELWRCKLDPADRNNSAVELSLSDTGKLIVTFKGRLWCFADGGTGLPTAPTGLKVEEAKDHLQLEWNSQPGAEGFFVYKGSASPQLIARVSEGNSYTDYSALSDIRSHYSVSAFNPLGEGSRSSTVSGHVATFHVDNGGGGDWSQESNDGARSFRSSVHGPAGSAELWRYEPSLPGTVAGAPLCSQAGFTYFVDNNGLLHCVNPLGKVTWLYGDGIVLAPALNSQGNIIVCRNLQVKLLNGEQSGPINLECLSPARGLLWRKVVSDETAFRLFKNDRIAAANSIDGLMLLESDGHELWSRNEFTHDVLSDLYVSPPSLSGETEILISTFDTWSSIHFLRFDTAGNLLQDLAGPLPAVVGWHGFSIREDGSMLGTFGQAGSFHPSGASEWGMQSSSGHLALLSGGRAYLGFKNPDSLRMVDRTGEIQWRKLLPNALSSNLATDAAGLVYLGLASGGLYCIDQSGATLWSHDANAGAIHSLAIGDDGRLFVSAEEALIAFGDS